MGASQDLNYCTHSKKPMRSKAKALTHKVARVPLKRPPERGLLLVGGSLIGAMLLQSWLAAPSFAQSASANSAANSAGTTVNNQNNSQINTSAFYGFGPGINCPTTTFALSGFSGNGSGASNGDVLGASVSSSNYGGIATVTVPIGGANQEICKEIGKAQVQALMSQVKRSNTEVSKTQADINLVTAIKCIELMRVATLTGLYAELCRGVTPFGQVPLGVTPRTPGKMSSAIQTEPEAASLIKSVPQTGATPSKLKTTSLSSQYTASATNQANTIATSTTVANAGKTYPRSVLERYE
jgi:hypothetical protein